MPSGGLFKVLMPNNIIQKLKKSELTGRGGAGFSTVLKWGMVKKARGAKKYVVCNASEGEPGVKKDWYLLEKYPEKIIDGMMIAIKYLKADEAFLYMNPDYYDSLQNKLKPLILNLPIKLFKKDHSAGYVGGTETTVLNHIEGHKIEPRLRPPFPVTKGLWGMPTLVNNVETFYDVSLINSGNYRNMRFYTIDGDCIRAGVYEFSEKISIKEILKKTDNYPDFDFFVQVGGGASGVILNSKQLDKEVGGSGSIRIYSFLKHNPLELMKAWADFFQKESCGQCVPCREGTFRLDQILNSEKKDWGIIKELLLNLEQSSLCGLGSAVPVPFFSFVKNVLNNPLGRKFKMEYGVRKDICKQLLG